MDQKSSRLLRTLVCGTIAMALAPVVLQGLESKIALSSDTLGAIAFIGLVTSMNLYLALEPFAMSRCLKALIGAVFAALVGLACAYTYSAMYEPRLFQLLLRFVIEDVIALSTAVFAAMAITERIFKVGRPLGNLGKSLALCGLLTPAIYLLVQEYLWGRNVVGVFNGDRFQIAVLCAAIGLNAASSFWLMSAAAMGLKLSKPFLGLVSRVGAALVAGIVFFLEIKAYYAYGGLTLPWSVHNALSFGEPVFLAALLSCQIVWFLVREPQPPKPPLRPAAPRGRLTKPSRR